MGDLFLSVFHSAVDENGCLGFISIYYANYTPTVSFTSYSLTNSSSLVFAFNVIQSVFAKEKSISLHISGQPKPSYFCLNAESDVWTFIQILVANGIVKSDLECPYRWIPASGVKPQDPVEWMFESSIVDAPMSVLHEMSGQAAFETLKGASFSGGAHRDKMEKLIERGKRSKTFEKLVNPVLPTEFAKYINNEKKLAEYLLIRKQWRCRIHQQDECQSKHNDSVQKLNQRIHERIHNESMSKLVYDVMRTMIQFAPDVAFVGEMVDLTVFVAEMLLNGQEEFDDHAQSRTFWALHKIWFDFGLALWYRDPENATKRLIREAKALLANVYPAVGYLVGYKNYAMFRQATEILVGLFTSTFADKELTRKLWNIMIEKASVTVLHLTVLVSYVCFELPDLVKTRVLNTGAVSQLEGNGYSPKSQEDFLALVAALAEQIRIVEPAHETVNLSFVLFKPITL